MRIRISAYDGSFGVNNPTKMTAISTLVGANDGFKTLNPLLYELSRYFELRVMVLAKFCIVIR